MATKRIPRPRDPIALAKLIGDIGTGQVADGKDADMAARGRKGGLRGGEARASSLSPERHALDFRPVSKRKLLRDNASKVFNL